MNQLKEFLARNKLVVSSVTLMALTVAVLFWNGAFDAPDPQGQVGVKFIKPVGTETAYTGSAVCASCHPSEFQQYITSPHAHTVAAILPGQQRPEFAWPKTVSDDHYGIRYGVRQDQGRNQFLATTGGQPEAEEARWAFGSGSHAWTYLAQHNDQFMELRISYYPPIHAWSFTPGNGPSTPLHENLGVPFTPVQAAACFGCHSTVITGSRRGLDLAHSILEVGCESCHGPGRSHVESARRFEDTASGNAAHNATAGGGAGAPVPLIKPTLHNGPQIIQLCGTCHRLPVPEDENHVVNDLQIARFPGVALARSRCFIASAGKLSCITCHNPHQQVSQQGIASFEQKCLSCHTAPHGKPCTQAKTSGCITCHMPLENVGGNLPLHFHNHWIRKNPSA